ncbi:endogenous retrovirus group 3 member 1 Env polyprotein-like [Scyliorhinus torazame]|uniref:endogenous retrovirus group 3 member 1 Env polyprotein-like n=1 Tax=Scyliorhinus torazame TaxID=75743 RepID=UPI003B5A9ABC
MVKEKKVKATPKPTAPQVYPSLYEEIQHEIQLLKAGGNLFVDLALRITQTLKVTNCWVCGGPLMSERWPWRGSTVEAADLFKWNITTSTHRRPQEWILTDTPLATECVANDPSGSPVKHVGVSPCKQIKTFHKNGSTSWWPKRPTWYWRATDAPIQGTCDNTTEGLWKCKAETDNPYLGIPGMKTWGHDTNKGGPAPEGLFWICGKRGYSILPPNWKGTCSLGLLQPGFFLLPKRRGNALGVRVFDDLRRPKRSVEIGTWKDEEWPRESNLLSWAGDLGGGWLMGLPHTNLYTEPRYQVAGCPGDHNEQDSRGLGAIG